MAAGRHAFLLKTLLSRHLTGANNVRHNYSKGLSRCLTSLSPSLGVDPADSSRRQACALRSDYSRSLFEGQLFKGIQCRVYSSSFQETPGGPLGPGGSEGFGDLTSQSVVTDDMLDSLIALKDFGDIEGLPPLDQILEEDEEKERKAIRREMEKKKQLEIAAKRVKTVDEFGRAYGTGRRKASTARVWIKEGEGNITINGKPHDLYFPDIDQRLQLLEPFWQTNQLGVFDVRATVKGGGVSGQSGALRHGISKALQLYDPNFRPTLKSAGMLTRDSRVVERKKPGKAKARKSYQWVKR
ncbi:unnamed protein product [Calypogeia fissa]